MNNENKPGFESNLHTTEEFGLINHIRALDERVGWLEMKLGSKSEAQGSGSEKYGASDWTAAGRTEDGFPVAKGSPEDVTPAVE